MDQITEKFDNSINPNQYAYTSYVVHITLTHLVSSDTYVRLLFLNFSSALIQLYQTLLYKLETLRLSITIQLGAGYLNKQKTDFQNP